MKVAYLTERSARQLADRSALEKDLRR